MKRFALLLFLLALSPAPLLADQIGQDEAREAVKRGDIRPLSEAVAKAESLYEGRILDAELERENGLVIYEIKLITKDGWRRKLYLDAKTLEVLKDKGKPSKDEHKP
jgi:uncharacterized membrane protein YkoI